jgi:hypothetical protein
MYSGDTSGISGGSPLSVHSCDACTVTCSGVNGGTPETVTVVNGRGNTAVVTLVGGPYGSCKNLNAAAIPGSAVSNAICKYGAGNCGKGLTLQNSNGTSVGVILCN